jgi:hypothetical protein
MPIVRPCSLSASAAPAPSRRRNYRNFRLCAVRGLYCPLRTGFPNASEPRALPLAILSEPARSCCPSTGQTASLQNRFPSVGRPCRGCARASAGREPRSAARRAVWRRPWQLSRRRDKARSGGVPGWGDTEFQKNSRQALAWRGHLSSHRLFQARERLFQGIIRGTFYGFGLGRS